MIPLPHPAYDGEMAVETAILQRISTRSFSGEPLQLAQLSQLLWSAQGATRGGKRRTAPSAGAIYPLISYAVVGNVIGLDPAIYQYLPTQHSLEIARMGDYRGELSSAAFNQESIKAAPASIVLSAVYSRMTARYSARAKRYIDMEIGHAGQNIYLQATALNLGTVAIGAFEEVRIQNIVSISADEEPLYIMPVGRSAPRTTG